MDKITKTIIFDLMKAGNPIEMISVELGIPQQDIRAVIQETEQQRISNILAEQLATRLPVLLELAMKQLQNIILTGNDDRKLRAINTVIQASTAIAKLRPQ